MKAGILPTLTSTILVVVCSLAAAHPALAQTEGACALPDGVAPPAEPSVTAQQVEDGSASLKDFVLAAKNRLSTPTSSLEEGLYRLCRVRQEGSPYRSGSTYLVFLTLDGRVNEHAKSMALSGRLLNPLIYAEILSVLGVSPSVLANLASPDSAIVAQAGAAVFGTLLQEPDAAFDATTSTGILGASGHVVATSTSNEGGVPILLLAGFDLNESHLVEEAIEHANPTVTARDVVDRETLKTFVTEAGEWIVTTLETATGPADIAKMRIGLRDPNGPWRHGPVYLYVLDLTANVILFHAAFPDRFEWRPLVPTVRDVVTGKLVLPQVMEAATSSPEGGFVEYYWDDPTDDTDRADIPKVGYARKFTAIGLTFIVGSGLYPSSDHGTNVETTTWGQVKDGFAE